MDLQHFRRTILYTVMGTLVATLLDFFVNFLKSMSHIMSAPVYSKQYTAISAQVQPEPELFWSKSTELLHGNHSILGNPLEKGANMILNTLPSEKMALLQLVDALIYDDIAMNRTHASPPVNSGKCEVSSVRDKMEATNELYDLCSEPTFCYFFISVHASGDRSTKENKCWRPTNTAAPMSSSQCVNDTNNNLSGNSERLFVAAENQLPATESKPVQSAAQCTMAEAASLPHRGPRQRNISECSEDSFICFTADNDDDDAAIINDENDESDCGDNESDIFYLSDQSDSDTDSSEDEEAEEDDDEEYDDNASLQQTELDCNISNIKKVRFNLQPEIHVMHVWKYAYRTARKGDYWQTFARDRARFQKRIENTATTLNAILTPAHRYRIYRERFTHMNSLEGN